MSSLTTSAMSSLLLGDLYSLKEFIYESRIGAPRFYLKLEEGSFERPSFFIKLVDTTLVPRIKEYRSISSQVMVQYFTEDFYDAQVVNTQLQMLLSGAPVHNDVVLPRYDFTTSPPTKCTVSGWDVDRTYRGDGFMGARIDPTTINSGGVQQEDNRAWNVPVTFTMHSPMPTWQDYPIIEDVIFDFITGTPVLAQVLGACVRGLPSVETTLVD